MQIRVGNHSSYPGAPETAARAQLQLGLDWITVHPSGAGDEITGVAASLPGACLGDPIVPPYRSMPCRRLRVQARLRNRLDTNPIAFDTSLVTGTPLKISLTGPYTLSRLAVIETTAYRGADHLAEELANHLADHVRDAVRGGVRFVQIDEPELLRSPSDVRLVRELLEPLQDAVENEAALSVSTYGAPVAELFAQLNSLPGSIVAFDCSNSPGTIDDLAATGSGKPVALGFGGFGELPYPTAIARQIDTATRRYAHDVLYLQPSCGLAPLPGDTARAILNVLIEARSLATGAAPASS